jgi:hypothetical protein
MSTQQSTRATFKTFHFIALSILILSVTLRANGKTQRIQQAHNKIYVVINDPVFDDHSLQSLPLVMKACQDLVNGQTDRILYAGKAYESQFDKPLSVDSYPAPESSEKSRWLRDWLSQNIELGDTVVLLGDEKAIPTWQVSIGHVQLTSDSFYSDLNADGVPDTAVVRILGTPEQMIQQLQGKKSYTEKALILCSEDTRIHLETRAFARTLANLGYDVSIQGSQDEQALAASNFIIHFGHGSSNNISNRFGETFVDAAEMPDLSRAPIVFVDGCGTLPVGSPLLRAFLAHGALAYCGSTATVAGMTPARFTNELVEHFLITLKEHPDMPLPHILWIARARYAQGHRGLASKLANLAKNGTVRTSGEQATHLLTLAEWVYYGDPRATIPSVDDQRPICQTAIRINNSVRLDSKQSIWRTSFLTKKTDGQAVLALHVEVPLVDRELFGLSVNVNGIETAILDSHQDTVYQRIGRSCQGGYVSGDTYRARYLVPLDSIQGEQQVEIRLVEGSSALLTPGSEINIWPDDFEQQIGLRQQQAFIPPNQIRRVQREPVNVVGTTRLLDTAIPGFRALDLSSVFNRPHNSMNVGGGDNASFKTWFKDEHVKADEVPFVVKGDGNNVLVSPNNTENVFEIKGIEQPARALHFLIWGYNRPNLPARLSIQFADNTSQELELPLTEWTQATGPVAFDFENTIRFFEHAAITHQTVQVEHQDKPISVITSQSGTYGLVAVTVESANTQN